MTSNSATVPAFDFNAPSAPLNNSLDISAAKLVGRKESRGATSSIETIDNRSVWAALFRANAARIAALHAGWDGPGSVPIATGLIHAAARFTGIALYGILETTTPPFLVPGGDGSLQLEWHGKRGELELDMDPSGKLTIWGRDYGNKFEFEGEDAQALDLFYRWAPWVASKCDDVVDVPSAPPNTYFEVAA